MLPENVTGSWLEGSTEKALQLGRKEQIGRVTFNVLQGLVMVVGNGIILLTVGRFAALRQRKEMLILITLPIADLTYGLGVGTFLSQVCREEEEDDNG